MQAYLFLRSAAESIPAVWETLDHYDNVVDDDDDLQLVVKTLTRWCCYWTYTPRSLTSPHSLESKPALEV